MEMKSERQLTRKTYRVKMNGIAVMGTQNKLKGLSSLLRKEA